MATSGEEIEDELLLLESIYTHELTEIAKSEDGRVERVVLKLEPATGDDHDKKYVCLTLHLALPHQYPDEPPAITIRNPRGLADQHLSQLGGELCGAAEERRGQCMLFDLIELAKESLTQSNVPHGDCVICLTNFDPADLFIKTQCYHYFHTQCLLRYVVHEEAELAREEEEHRRNNQHRAHAQRKVGCPVCRCELDVTGQELTVASPPVREEPFSFRPDAVLLAQQVRMRGMLERQRARGGLIDLEEERNKYLLSNARQVIAAQAEDSNTEKPADDPRADIDCESPPRDQPSAQPARRQHRPGGRGRGKHDWRHERHNRDNHPSHHHESQYNNEKRNGYRGRNETHYKNRDHTRRHKNGDLEEGDNEAASKFPHPRRQRKHQDRNTSEKSSVIIEEQTIVSRKADQHGKQAESSLERIATPLQSEKSDAPEREHMVSQRDSSQASQGGSDCNSHQDSRTTDRTRENNREVSTNSVHRDTGNSDEGERYKDKPAPHRFTFKNKKQKSPRDSGPARSGENTERKPPSLRDEQEQRPVSRGRGRGFNPRHKPSDQPPDRNERNKTRPSDSKGSSRRHGDKSSRNDGFDERPDHRDKRPDMERYDSRAKHTGRPHPSHPHTSHPSHSRPQASQPRRHEKPGAASRGERDSRTHFRHGNRHTKDSNHGLDNSDCRYHDNSTATNACKYQETSTVTIACKNDGTSIVTNTCKYVERSTVTNAGKYDENSHKDATNALRGIAQCLSASKDDGEKVTTTINIEQCADSYTEKRAPPGFCMSGPPPGFTGSKPVSAPPGFS